MIDRQVAGEACWRPFKGQGQVVGLMLQGPYYALVRWADAEATFEVLVVAPPSP